MAYENVHIVRRMMSGRYALVNTKTGTQGRNDITNEIILSFADYMHNGGGISGCPYKYQGAHHGDTKHYMFYTEDKEKAQQIAELLSIGSWFKKVEVSE